jgi:hypothetical protein
VVAPASAERAGRYPWSLANVSFVIQGESCRVQGGGKGGIYNLGIEGGFDRRAPRRL